MLEEDKSKNSEMVKLPTLKDWIDRLSELRDKISPEKEYLIGAFATYMYLLILVSPESLPGQIQPMLEMLNGIDKSSFSLKLTTMIAFTGSVDGARRIVLERLPSYKAYLQVFLLNKFE
ncbi:MAG: hypothetical protein H6772_04005 [Pseudomonadales bacterium]|nr:hypothetical protein [Pseudomonadales bacterium]